MCSRLLPCLLFHSQIKIETQPYNILSWIRAQLYEPILVITKLYTCSYLWNEKSAFLFAHNFYVHASLKCNAKPSFSKWEQSHWESRLSSLIPIAQQTQQGDDVKTCTVLLIKQDWDKEISYLAITAWQFLYPMNGMKISLKLRDLEHVKKAIFKKCMYWVSIISNLRLLHFGKYY